MLHRRNIATIKCSPAFRAVFAASIVLALVGTFTPVNSFANTPQVQAYLGTAYGTYAYVGGTILVGQTAPLTLGGQCGTDQEPLNLTASAAGLNLPLLVTGGAVNTNVSSAPQTAQAIADTANISLLAGLITAQEMKAVSTTTIDSSGNFHVSSAGTIFSNLIVLGHVYNGSVPANTRINLPLLGYVVLNEQTSSIGTSMANLAINMIHIHVTSLNLLHLQIGTEVIVSSVNSGLIHVYAPGILTGESFGTQVIGPLLASSPTAPEILPCVGTGGAVLTNSLNGVNLPSILNTGTVTDTVESNLTPSMSTGQNNSTVQGLNLLNGLVTVNVIHAQVNASIYDQLTYVLNGSDTFVGISVAGHPEINDSVPTNTSVPIAGLGTLYLKRIINNRPVKDGVEVRSVELVINQTNTFGLPIGLDVIIGDAQIQLGPIAKP